MVTLLMGYPAAGKSSIADLKQHHEGRTVLNRDKAGGKVTDLLPQMDQLLKAGKKVLLDNTFPTAESRKPFIKMADVHGCPITCLWLTTSIEQAQFNACLRMIRQHGKILSPEEMKKAKEPSTYPPAVLFKYRKDFEAPKIDEGFEAVCEIPFVRRFGDEYKNGATIFDYDGTLRKTKSGGKWPTDPKDVVVLKNRKIIANLKSGASLWMERLLGASNQSGIAKGDYTEDDARACFDKTNELLGVDIDYEFCPHRIPPMSCWCRKPMPGLGVHFIEKYKLDPAKVTMVGDMTSDKTFAARCGFRYVDAEEFFV